MADTARDVIAQALRDDFGPFGPRAPSVYADSLIEVLHAAGYRILAPGELDALHKTNASDIDAWRGAVDRMVGLMADADKRAEKAERERDRFREECTALREVVATYGDRLRMSNAPAHLQQAIDDAIRAFPAGRSALTEGRKDGGGE